MAKNEQEQIRIIAELLEEAMNEGLESEVIYYALKYMQEDPELTPLLAFRLGYEEWIK